VSHNATSRVQAAAEFQVRRDVRRNVWWSSIISRRAKRHLCGRSQKWRLPPRRMSTRVMPSFFTRPNASNFPIHDESKVLCGPRRFHSGESYHLSQRTAGRTIAAAAALCFAGLGPHGTVSDRTISCR